MLRNTVFPLLLCFETILLVEIYLIVLFLWSLGTQ